MINKLILEKSLSEYFQTDHELIRDFFFYSDNKQSYNVRQQRDQKYGIKKVIQRYSIRDLNYELIMQAKQHWLYTNEYRKFSIRFLYYLCDKKIIPNCPLYHLLVIEDFIFSATPCSPCDLEYFITFDPAPEGKPADPGWPAPAAPGAAGRRRGPWRTDTPRRPARTRIRPAMHSRPGRPGSGCFVPYAYSHAPPKLSMATLPGFKPRSAKKLPPSHGGSTATSYTPPQGKSIMQVHSLFRKNSPFLYSDAGTFFFSSEPMCAILDTE